MAKRKGIPAAAFMASFSSAGRAIAPAAPVAPARITTVVERWNGERWIEKQLEWNGTEYKEIN